MRDSGRHSIGLYLIGQRGPATISNQVSEHNTTVASCSDPSVADSGGMLTVTLISKEGRVMVSRNKEMLSVIPTYRRIQELLVLVMVVIMKFVKVTVMMVVLMLVVVSRNDVQV